LPININVGVLLINLKKWRDKGFEDIFINFIETLPIEESVNLNDNFILNEVSKHKILPLPRRYNTVSDIFYIDYKTLKEINYIEDPETYPSLEDFNNAKNNPAIIHFTGSSYGRPWEENYKGRFKKEYNHYKNLSPWKDVPLERLSFSTKLYRFFITSMMKHFPGWLISFLIDLSTSYSKLKFKLFLFRNKSK
jgi:lipopolysaccharide biosynthesis glycosyltransferase